MKKFLCIISIAFLFVLSYASDTYVYSPDNTIRSDLVFGDSSITLKLLMDNNQIFSLKGIRLLTDKNRDSKLRILQILNEKSTDYNGLLVRFTNGLAIEVRLFDNGLAYRWIVNFSDSIIVFDENMNLVFPQDYTIFFPKERSFVSHYERRYIRTTLAEIKDQEFASLPVLIKSEQFLFLVSDADLYDYPNMFLQKKTSFLSAIFPRVPLELKPKFPRSDRDQKIMKEADYIARISGDRTLPWRVFMLAREDKELLNNNLVYELSRPNSQVWDFSWVKPGKVAWDWWNARQLEGVNFKPGINTITYKYYIDFAAKYGLDYVILDEGWSKTTWDLLHFRPDMDVKYLIKYARSKNIGIILWVLWNPLNQNMTQVLDSFALWGAAGIKVDFMQRADQEMVNFYERTAHEAAKRHLIVDFHGAYKPSGLRRAYPNILSYEGVMGAEHNKWSRRITPTHNLLLPFTRNVVGPMDYTPGGMRNTTKQKFSISWKHPQVMGTRAHQVAMYVVYYSPLQMLADSPTSYEQNDETTRFIAEIPTVWDKTVPLKAKVGEYVAVARKHGDNWYIGVMNGEKPRNITLDLNFLPAGQDYTLRYFADSKASATEPTKYDIDTMKVDNKTKLNVSLAWGGGYAAILTPVK